MKANHKKMMLYKKHKNSGFLQLLQWVFLLSLLCNGLSYASQASLDSIIPPQISKDLFSSVIEELAAMSDVYSILEIGSSSGDGSTASLFKGALKNSNHPKLFCIEASQPRFRKLQRRYKSYPQVFCYNVSSISLEDFPSTEEVQTFWNEKNSLLRQWPLEMVLTWLQDDIAYVKSQNIPQNGIAIIKKEHQIELFDLVLIDGSEFAGFKEMNLLYGAKYILLDDTRTFKNWQSFENLCEDRNYRLIINRPDSRNGFAVFQKI